MIYLDASVVLAWLFAEDARPSDDLWLEALTSSRVLEYEVWSRLYSREADIADIDRAKGMLQGVEYIELSREALDRALQPFPLHVRTLDALHLATMVFLRRRDRLIELASYDARLLTAARALDIPVRKL